MLIAVVADSQLVNNGATITVQSGATIKCTGTIQNNSGGIIQNAGTVSSDGELRNETGGTLTNNGTAGTYEATTKFINNGNAFTGINLKLIGSVNTDSIKTGAGSTFANVDLAKGAGNTATLSDAMTVNGAFTFDNDDNRLIIADKNLTMGPSATFVSADANDFVVTSSTGTVIKQNLGSISFTYPVGFGAGEYNPLSVSNSGTVDNISVRCLQNVLDHGLTGSQVASHFANNGWLVSEAGSGANLQLIAGWTAPDELPPFNRLKAGIARYNTGTDWDLPASNVLAASGSGTGVDPYIRSRSNITSLGVFAVADLAQVNTAKLNLKVFLQGPYNGTTMNDGLRTNNLIPATQPYSAALDPRFTRVGVYDGSVSVNETVNPSVFTITGNDAIVDWVYVSTLDPTTPATKLQTRAALLQRDGDIVDLDGVSPLSVPIDADGNYHVLVSHRNHLSIRTSSALSLADNATLPYFFTTAQAQAYQDGTIATNAAMAQNGSAFLMWAGNANLDVFVRVTSQAIPPIPSDASYILGSILSGNPNSTVSTYSIGDINMDGKVRATSQAIPPIPSDVSFILGTPLGGNNNATRKEHK